MGRNLDIVIKKKKITADLKFGLSIYKLVCTYGKFENILNNFTENNLFSDNIYLLLFCILLCFNSYAFDFPVHRM